MINVPRHHGAWWGLIPPPFFFCQELGWGIDIQVMDGGLHCPSPPFPHALILILIDPWIHNTEQAYYCRQYQAVSRSYLMSPMLCSVEACGWFSELRMEWARKIRWSMIVAVRCTGPSFIWSKYVTQRTHRDYGLGLAWGQCQRSRRLPIIASSFIKSFLPKNIYILYIKIKIILLNIFGIKIYIFLY